MDGSLTPLQFPVAAPPRPGETLAIAPGRALVAHAAPLRARPHQFVGARRRRGLDNRRHRLRDGPNQGAVGTDLCRAARRIADHSDHRDALSPGPHRARRLAHPALAGAVMGDREGMAVRPSDEPWSRGFRPDAASFRAPRGSRRHGSGAFQRTGEQLPPRRPVGAGEFSAACRRDGDRDRRTRMAGHRRRRPCAGARMSLLRPDRCADRGRPGIAEDLAQHQRPSTRARRRSPRPLSRVLGQIARRGTARDAYPALAQPPVFRIAHADREPCRASPGALRRGDRRLRASRRPLSNWSRFCSGAPSTGTRWVSRSARRSPT